MSDDDQGRQEDADDRKSPKFTDGRGPRGRFCEGNPGRPRGARGRAAQLSLEILEAEAEAITRKVANLALEGDPAALRIVMDRLCPVPQGRVIELDLPPVETPRDLVSAFAALLGAVAAGQLAPAEAVDIGKLAEALGKAFELRDLAERVRELETRLDGSAR